MARFLFSVLAQYAAATEQIDPQHQESAVRLAASIGFFGVNREVETRNAVAYLWRRRKKLVFFG